MRAVFFLGLAAVAKATCVGEQCASGQRGEEGDAAALMQFQKFGPLPPGPEPFKPTPAPTPSSKDVVIGTPLSGYHNVTIWTYYLALKNVSFDVHKVIFEYEHPILYPMFTGKGGEDVCAAEGCPDKCNESGLGYRTPCVDFVVDANIPVNHASYIKDYQDQYLVMGTAFETQYIALWAPAYTGWKTLYDAQDAGNAMKDTKPMIYGQIAGVDEGCDTLYCPKCPGQGYITGAPLVDESNVQNWTFEAYSCEDFIAEIEAKLDAKEEFLVQYWTPNVLANYFVDRIVELNMLPYINKPNQGKALIRRDSISKFTDVAYAALGAVFLGTEDVRTMDAWSHGFNVTNDYTGFGPTPKLKCPSPSGKSGKMGGKRGGKLGKSAKGGGRGVSDVPYSGGQGPCQLCDHMSWNENCALEAAKMWIEQNTDRVLDDGTTQPGVWESFFW